MTIEIEIDGRRRQVALRREDDRWVAQLDGREITVSVSEVAGRWSMLVLPPEGGSHGSLRVEGSVASGFPGPPKLGTSEGGSRKSYDIAFEPMSGGELVVHVNGVAVPLSIVDRRRRRRLSGSGESGTDTRPKAIAAPMPGRIVRVLVQPGEAVRAGQGLIVVEAMKMENELRAPRGGTVAEVRVREGASVEADAVLVVLR